MGNRIKMLRVSKNMKQSELAERLHVTPTTVSNWELEKNEPDNKTLHKLASMFNTTTDYILGRSGNPLNYAANSISNSSLVHSPVSLAVSGDKRVELTPEEEELIRVYRGSGVKERHKLMECAFNIEKNKGK
jgi:transcriptional regulator with XRE-family HTH domain